MLDGWTYGILVLSSNPPIIAVCVFLYNMIVKLIKKIGQFLLPVLVSGSNSYFVLFLSKILMNVTIRIPVLAVHVQTLLVISHVLVVKVIISREILA